MLKKLTPFWLPVCIWALMIFYHGVVVRLLTEFWITVSAPFFLGIILHTLIQFLIICPLTITAVKRLGYNIKSLRISLPIMLLLFAVFTPTSLYLFVYTVYTEPYTIGWGENHPEMPFWLKGIIITLQYGIVMLITTVVATANKKQTD